MNTVLVLIIIIIIILIIIFLPCDNNTIALRGESSLQQCHHLMDGALHICAQCAEQCSVASAIWQGGAEAFLPPLLEIKRLSRIAHFHHPSLFLVLVLYQEIIDIRGKFPNYPFYLESSPYFPAFDSDRSVVRYCGNTTDCQASSSHTRCCFPRSTIMFDQR